MISCRDGPATGRTGAGQIIALVGLTGAGKTTLVKLLTGRYEPTGFGHPARPDFGGLEPSVGQWRTLALSRGLLRPAPVLVVLDEPTAALDAQVEHEMFSYLAEWSGRRPPPRARPPCWSHRFSTMRIADLIVVIEHGEIAELGDHEQLMAAGGTYAELYRRGDGGELGIVGRAGPPARWQCAVASMARYGPAARNTWSRGRPPAWGGIGEYQR